MNRRVFATMLVLVAAAMTAASSGAETNGRSVQRGSTVMKIAFTGSDNEYDGLGLKHFKQYVEHSAAKKDISVQLYFNGTLGTQDGAYDEMRLGTIQAYYGPQTSAERTVPAMGIFDLPYIFNGVKGINKALLKPSKGNKPIRARYAKLLKATGVKLLSFFYGGERDLYNNRHVVMNPSDLSGMKIRILNSPVYNSFWSAMGADPTPISFPEVYLALQSGTLDGAETAWAAAVAVHHDQVAKYWERTQHAEGVSMLGVNARWFSALSKKDQQALQTAAGKASAWAENEAQKELKSTIQKLKGEGDTVVTPHLAAFRRVARGVIKHYECTYGVGAINKISRLEGVKPLPPHHC